LIEVNVIGWAAVPWAWSIAWLLRSSLVFAANFTTTPGSITSSTPLATVVLHVTWYGLFANTRRVLFEIVPQMVLLMGAGVAVMVGMAVGPTAVGVAVSPAAVGVAVGPTAVGVAVSPAAVGVAVAPTAVGVVVAPTAVGVAVEPPAVGVTAVPVMIGVAVVPAAVGVVLVAAGIVPVGVIANIVPVGVTDGSVLVGVGDGIFGRTRMVPMFCEPTNWTEKSPRPVNVNVTVA